MECNRDEAKRAKEIAERKFSTKDIMGAKKFALKAQSLYPGLDGISQFLAILDVYVAVENKINGELDFYGILGVNPLADDDMVRKHYRKLALSLHPDKNKSVGADGAFKYVSEAWTFLSDKEKRTAYDRRRNVKSFKQRVPAHNGGSRAAPPPEKNGFYHFTKSTSSRAKGASDPPKDNPSVPAKTGPVSVTANKPVTPKTFWTVCKRCMMQYEFVRMYVNRKLLCPGCHEPFLAIETPPPAANGSSGVPKNGAGKNVANPDPRKTTGVEPAMGCSTNYATFQWVPFPKKSSPAAVAQAATMVQRAYEKVKREREEAQAAVKRDEALRRKIAKKTSKRKHDLDVFCAKNETGPVEDDSNIRIKNRLMKKATTEIRNKLREWSSETTKNNKRVDPFVTHVTDPEFHDFDRDRSEKSFENGQVWAAYDDHDGMPRFYAVIRKVISLDPFKIKVCWLDPKPDPGPEPDPDPFPGFSKAFGEFKAGRHETVSVSNYFSHKVVFEKRGSGTVNVFPRKGDVWALLHKNDQTQTLDYEIVEIDGYDEIMGATVAPLVKVSGYKTVFCRHLEPRVVPKNEMVRVFSHQIPSYLLAGQETSSGPKGGRELDPAGIPFEFLKVLENIKKDDEDCGLADFKDEEGSKY